MEKVPLPPKGTLPSISPSTGAGPKPISRPSYNWVYYPLALSLVLIVAISLYLNHELTEVYEAQISFVQTTTNRTGRLLELRRASSDVEDAGTNVLSEEDLAVGPERVQEALKVFNDRVASLRNDLKSSPDKDETGPWLHELDQVEKSVAEMGAYDNQIFGFQKQNDHALAAKYLKKVH